MVQITISFTADRMIELAYAERDINIPSNAVGRVEVSTLDDAQKGMYVILGANEAVKVTLEFD